MGLLRRNHTDDEHVVKGPSPARGPAHLIGTALLVFGLLALIDLNDFPSFSDNFTDGTATGGTFLGIGANGWTAWLCIASGGLLLIGAAQHVAARTMALIVGLILGAASVIALRDGDDVLGLAYASGPTKLGLGLAAAALLLTALLPRTRKKAEDTDHVDRDHHVAPVHTEDHAEAPQRTGRFERSPESVRGSDVEPVPAGRVEPAEHADRTEPAHQDTSHGTTPRTTGTRREGGVVGRLRRLGDR